MFYQLVVVKFPVYLNVNFCEVDMFVSVVVVDGVSVVGLIVVIKVVITVLQLGLVLVCYWGKVKS